MLKELKRKFILISMISVFFVLAFTIGAINLSNYIVIENEASRYLTEVIRHGPEESRIDEGGSGEEMPSGGERKEDHNPNDNLRSLHYFIAVFDEAGTITEYNYEQMFRMSETECTDLVTKVYSNELNGGKYQTYRYQKETKENGLTYVAFVDIKEKLDDFNNFLLSSSLISIGAYLALLALIVVASNIAFKPSEEAYKKQKKFITNASHELKTPLTIISTDLDLIEMDSGKSEWSESIRDQVMRLTVMTNQLVDLSKLDEGESTNYPFSDFSINEVCNKAIKSFSDSFKKEKIKFAYNITGNLTMYGNKHLIDEMIYIFLYNSLKYSGGEQKSSYFTVSENSNGKIEFRFSNTLDKDDEVDAKQILERFYRSPSNKKEGSGIGLSIAKEIINLHKGKIKVDKNSNTIAFTITFN